jgi:uroporphyrinogen III methyltransferase/synthase
MPAESMEKAQNIFARFKSSYQTNKAPLIVTFTSSSTVDNFLRLLPEKDRASLLDRLKLASIGPITSDSLRRHGLEPQIEAREFTVPSLIQAIVDFKAKADK